MEKLFILLIGCVVISSCEEKPPVPKPELLMEKATYTDIFYELELLRIYQNRGTSGNIIDSLYTEIFKKYDADTALFRQSHEFYQTQIKEQQELVDSVINQIKKELDEFDKLDSLLAQEKELKE